MGTPHLRSSSPHPARCYWTTSETQAARSLQAAGIIFFLEMTVGNAPRKSSFLWATESSNTCSRTKQNRTIEMGYFLSRVQSISVPPGGRRTITVCNKSRLDINVLRAAADWSEGQRRPLLCGNDVKLQQHRGEREKFSESESACIVYWLDYWWVCIGCSGECWLPRWQPDQPNALRHFLQLHGLLTR